MHPLPPLSQVAAAWVLLLAAAGSCHAAGIGSNDRGAATEVDANVSLVADIVYTRPGQRALRLDLYRPKAPQQSPLPLVIVIRGGGWRHGDKAYFGPTANWLAANGFAAASIEYRTADEAFFPAALEDVRAAVRWVSRDGHRWGLDPAAVGLFGGSAGAHLALLTATTGIPTEAGEPPLRVAAAVSASGPTDLTDQQGAGNWSETAIQQRQALIANFLGVSLQDDPERWRQASPLHHLQRDSPPMLLLQGTADPIVPYQQAEIFEARCRALAASCEVHLFPHGSHGFWKRQPWRDQVEPLILTFYRRWLTPPQ